MYNGLEVFEMKKIFLLLMCACLLVSCTKNKTEPDANTVAMVADTKITVGELGFYLESIKDQLSAEDSSLDWQTEIEGEKAIDIAKKRALEIAVSNIEYCKVAEANGITLSEKDKSDISLMKQQFITQCGGGDAYNKFLKEKDITDDFIQLICESVVYYEKLSNKYKEEEPFTEEELLSYYIANKETVDGDYKKAKHILILTMNPETGEVFSEAVKNEKKALAEKLLGRIQAGEDFDALMKEYTEDPGLGAYPDGYLFKPGDMVQEFENAVDSVGYGEIVLCQSDYGYHIIKRLPVEYEDVSELVEEAAMRDKISEKLKEWEKENNIKVEINEEAMKRVSEKLTGNNAEVEASEDVKKSVK